ncbi:pyrroline-5-carboxylate reductase, partial [Oleiphilus sp. HI0079]|uniref:pyrroline-5-carboxylate reductase family protein n=2 Tax=Oleiphilus TaxID=141450 RepID=UPI000AE3E40A
ALGLEAESAKRLAAQTAMGAAKMVLESDLPAEQLKRNVMSPGGTTERAIHVFENDGLPELVSKAMTACADRSKEMAELLSDK